MCLLPGSELKDDFAISIGRTHAGWSVHKDLPVSGAFELDEIVGEAEFFEFRVSEFSAGNEAHGEPGRRERQDGGHGHSLSLRLEQAKTIKGMAEAIPFDQKVLIQLREPERSLPASPWGLW